MRKSVLVASAKPKQHKVYVKRKTFIYANIRQQQFVGKDEVMKWIGEIAKLTLKRVKYIVNKKRLKNE